MHVQPWLEVSHEDQLRTNKQVYRPHFSPFPNGNNFRMLNGKQMNILTTLITYFIKLKNVSEKMGPAVYSLKC